VTQLTYGGVSVDLSKVEVTSNNTTSTLSKNEYLTLKELLKHPEAVVSRETLMETLWDSDQFIDDNTLTVTMTRLKKKLGTIGVDNFIHTKKGIGYYVKIS
jgi:DNA-binding response OmpR family regulator